jgi:phosphoglucomutase
MPPAKSHKTAGTVDKFPRPLARVKNEVEHDVLKTSDHERKVRDAIEAAHAQRLLLDSAATNVAMLLQSAPTDLYLRAIDELVSAGQWSELNDRFYKTLAFGTGGLRGRTIGRVVTRPERGIATTDSPPEHPCVGTNAMNLFNISRATQGLVGYVQESARADAKAATSTVPNRGEPGDGARARIVIAHDTRFFSKQFAELAARVAADYGCDAFLFDGPRSTPELSFAVRHLQASAGIVITASHNPPHDNGYKVYFSDGAQVVEPHASGIIARVNAVTSETYEPLPAAKQGHITILTNEIDAAYMERLQTLILDPALVRQAHSLRLVFSPIHGTGGIIIKPMLERLGFQFETVAEQDRFDGAFPTVKSPNPENAEALRLGVELANRTGADLVLATDPDCDRMGVAARTRSGEMNLLTGNQIGSLIAYYRASKLFELGVLNNQNAKRGVIIKTFVTTDLQKAIAEHFGLRCVETLTGFKYIGQKLAKYEHALEAALEQSGITYRPYQQRSEKDTRELRLTHSSFYVFGGEESYGYSGADFVRDKDGNGAVLMFCEVAAFAKSRGQTIDELLDDIFSTFGYFQENHGSLVFEGAQGAARIARLAESYAKQPPKQLLGTPVTRVVNFATETIRDVEGDEIPKEKMSLFELEDRTRIAVRPSGTEPKIKYYLFAQQRPRNGRFAAAELARIKTEVGARLDQLWIALEKDAEARLAG